jgi:hypothetical protein
LILVCAHFWKSDLNTPYDLYAMCMRPAACHSRIGWADVVESRHKRAKDVVEWILLQI